MAAQTSTAPISASASAATDEQPVVAGRPFDAAATDGPGRSNGARGSRAGSVIGAHLRLRGLIVGRRRDGRLDPAIDRPLAPFAPSRPSQMRLSIGPAAVAPVPRLLDHADETNRART